jgi:selenocysteine lyase/cysteine desulfurase
MIDPSSTKAFATFRAGFPGLLRFTYVDVAARGIISKPVRDAIETYLDQRMEGADKASMFEEVERTRSDFARFINADVTEVAFTRNVSDGINAFASALRWRAGDNVVMCEALEHPANVYPWHNLNKLAGVHVKVVAPQDGLVSLERICDAVDNHTRVVTVSSVSFSPGARFPVAELGSFCRSRRILLVVDAAQSVGIMNTDVRKLNVDALAASTQKGLLALYGSGFLYVRREIADDLWPRYLSRPAILAESGHEAASGDPNNLRLADGARRFDVGNHNFLAAVAVKRSLTALSELGVSSVEKWTCALASRLALRLADLGLPVYGRGSEGSSHIVTVGNALTADHDTTQDARLLALHAHLVQNGVKFTIRRGLLRFSFHAYNNESDVDRIADLASDWKSKHS